MKRTKTLSNPNPAIAPQAALSEIPTLTPDEIKQIRLILARHITPVIHARDVILKAIRDSKALATQIEADRRARQSNRDKARHQRALEEARRSAPSQPLKWNCLNGRMQKI